MKLRLLAPLALFVSFALQASQAGSGALERPVSIVNHNGGVVLAGTLATPAQAEPKAAIVMATGSGQQNRDEEVAGHRPFKVISDYLSNRGYAVLRMDDRGVGESGGDYSTASLADFTADIEAGLAWLDSCYSGKPVGVLGHSMGGSEAIRIAASKPECGFIVTLAAPAWPGDSVCMWQGRAIALAAVGHWDAEQLQRRLLDVAKSDLPPFMARPILISEMSAQYGDAVKLPRVQKQLAAGAESLLIPWYRDLLRYNPASDIAAIAIPWLALNGTLDMQVPPASLKTIEELNPKADIRLLPRHNHLFQHAKSGFPQEYAEIAEDISEETLETIYQWLEKTVAGQ